MKKFLNVLDFYMPLVEKQWFKLFHHWLNPFGNYHEPLPYPLKWADKAQRSVFPSAVWWLIRNPLHNFTHFWVGITPIGERYEWRRPEENGWKKEGDVWRKGWMKLPRTGWIRWQSRGNLRLFKFD